MRKGELIIVEQSYITAYKIPLIKAKISDLSVFPKLRLMSFGHTFYIENVHLVKKTL